MDPQSTVPQTPIPVSQPVSPPPVQPHKKHTFVWISIGIIVLLIGIGIGMFVMHPMH